MNNSHLKNKTWEEILGVERAKKRREFYKNKTHEDIFGIEKSKKIKDEITKRQKGISYIERFGEERAKEILSKLRVKKPNYKLKIQKKGKTWEEMYGIERAKKLKEAHKLRIIKMKDRYPEINKKISLSKRKNMDDVVEVFKKRFANKPFNKGAWNKNMGDICSRQTIKNRFGGFENFAMKCGINFLQPTPYKKTKKQIENHRNSLLNMDEKKRKLLSARISEQKTIKKEYIVSEFKKIFNKRPFFKNDWDIFMKHICTSDTVRNKFGSLDDLAKICNVKFLKPQSDKYGRYESLILNKIEKEKNIKLIRQYRVKNKFIDGYDPINNIAYEVDESYHKSKQTEDFLREQEIIKFLDCEFVRIDENNFLLNNGITLERYTDG